MPTIDRPAIEFVDVEKVLLSIAPKDADGRTIDPAPEVVWTVEEQVPADDEVGDVLTLMEGDTPFETWAISGAPGTCVVCVTDGTIIERMPVTIKYGAPDALNLSAGTPVPE